MEANKQTRVPIIFSILSALLLFSFLSTYNLFLGMYDIFQDVWLHGTANDPKIMAGEISNALVLPLSNLFLAFPGWLCAMGVLLFSQYHPKFMKNFWLVCGLVLTVNAPFGILFGIVLLLTLFIKRERKNAIQTNQHTRFSSWDAKHGLRHFASNFSPCLIAP